MASRIRHSWQALAARLPGRIDDRGFVEVLRAWLVDDLVSVSVHTAKAFEQAPGVRLFLESDPRTLPISLASARGFAAALRAADLPPDPVAYVQFVDRLCWSLGVFGRDDDCCPRCYGELELWSNGSATFERCDFLGCCFDARGANVTPSEALRPARRDEVLRRYPEACLLR